MRVICEQPGRGIVRLGAYDGVGRHRVADVGDPVARDGLGLAERRAHLDDRGLVFLDPLTPRRNALRFALLAFACRKRLPARQSKGRKRQARERTPRA